MVELKTDLNVFKGSFILILMMPVLPSDPSVQMISLGAVCPVANRFCVEDLSVALIVVAADRPPPPLPAYPANFAMLCGDECERSWGLF